jgi:tetratricopeptide (TPR) repeat protein
MFVKSKNILLRPILCGVLFVTPLPAMAQGSSEPLADFSMEMDALPPQPMLEEEKETLSNNSIDMVVEQILVDAPAQSELIQETTENFMPEALVVEQAPKAIPHSGTYYDATSIGESTTGNSMAPRQVDPRYEPGSSFVVVQKTSGANSIPARITAAQRALSLGRYASALELYDQLYSENPNSKQILMGLAVAQQQSGFNESAIATYEELLKSDPKNIDAMSNMLGLIKTQYPSVAYRRLRDLWEKNSGNANIAAELGLVSSSLGQEQDALSYLGVAVSLEPNNASHYYNMAIISDRAGLNKEAIDLYQKALEVDAAYGASRTIQRDQVYDRLAHLRRL